MIASMQKTGFRLSCLAGMFAVAMALPGCGASPASPYPLQVWGRMTHNGNPLQGGLVMFEPEGPVGKTWGIGAISEDGNYKLASSVPDLPLQPGSYRVFIKPPSPKKERKHRRSEEEDNESDEKQIAIAVLFPVAKQYFKSETSGLKVELENEPTRVDIDLKEK